MANSWGGGGDLGRVGKNKMLENSTKSKTGIIDEKVLKLGKAPIIRHSHMLVVSNVNLKIIVGRRN
jgi:hypothetical protein